MRFTSYPLGTAGKFTKNRILWAEISHAARIIADSRPAGVFHSRESDVTRAR
jgi:hypothetical protein